MTTLALILSILTLLGLVAGGIAVRYYFVPRSNVAELVRNAVKKELDESAAARGFVNSNQLENAIKKAIKGLVKRDWLTTYYSSDADVKKLVEDILEEAKKTLVDEDKHLDEDAVNKLIEAALEEAKKTLVDETKLETHVQDATKDFVTEVALKNRLDAQASAPPPDLGSTITTGYPSQPPTRVDSPQKGADMAADEVLRRIEELKIPEIIGRLDDVEKRASNNESRSSKAMTAVRRLHEYTSNLQRHAVNPTRKSKDEEVESLETELREGHLQLKTAAEDAEGEYALLCGSEMKENPSDSDLRFEAERHIGDLRKKDPKRTYTYDEELELKRQYIRNRAQHKAAYDERVERTSEKAERARKALQDFEASTDVKKKQERIKALKTELKTFDMLDNLVERIYQVIEPGAMTAAKPKPRRSKRPLPSPTPARTPTLRPSALPPSDTAPESEPPMMVGDDEVLDDEAPDSVPSLRELLDNSSQPPRSEADSSP